jgi:H+/Cl- antiporter ClcA
MRMNGERIQPIPYLKLLLTAALIGLFSAAITYGFMRAVSETAELIWGHVEESDGTWQSVLTIVLCAVGGIVVGILVRIFGDHTGIFAELMQQFGSTGRFKYRQAPGMVLTALVSLIMGGSLGPEAPMADACGSVGTWLAQRLRKDERTTRSMGYSGISGMLGAFVTSPFSGALLALESARSAISLPWMLFPSLVSSAVATVTFVMLSGSLFGSVYVFPEYSPHLTDLLWAVPLGLAGAAAGAVFIILFRVLRRGMKRLGRHYVVRGLLGGLGLGVAGALWPLVLFSGEEQAHTLIVDVGKYSVLALITMALVKLVITSLLLSTGWKGGYIFPTMFAGIALGLAVHLIIPSIPLAVAVAATMGGAMVATMKAPLFSALFTAMLVQRDAAPVVAIAVIVGLLATARLSMVPPPDADGAQPSGDAPAGPGKEVPGDTIRVGDG